MTRPRLRFDPTPRIWNEFQVAARFNRGSDWLSDHRADLEAEGFPAVDALLGGTDADAIDRWLDQRSGIANAALADADKELEEWQP